MASDVTLRLLLTGVDKSASKSLKGVGSEAGKTGGKLDKLKGAGKVAGAAMAAGLLVAGAAAVDFAGDSLRAFSDAEKSQAKLEDAYGRFPKMADVNIDALRKYNQAVQRKTGADADDLAAAQASLGMFGLTGRQIKATTPLLVDYANKTGKDMPTAAKTMGKALLGNTKALKDMGISYKSTGDPAKDYANIMGLLKDKVGGYTASLPAAETKSKVLAASFGDLQEAVGEKLQPVMIKIVDAGQAVMDWLEANPAVAAGAAAAFDLVGQALNGIWEIIKAFVLPGLAMFIRANASVIRGVQGMLEALGTLPGFEWAKTAATNVGKIATTLDTVADGIDAVANAKPPVIKVKDEASAKVTAINSKIQGLKGKLVTARAKGDTKEVDRLKAKIDRLRDKRVDINAHVRKTGVTTIKAINVGNGLRLSAYRSGGRPKVGEIAQFHKDEFWVPDTAGTVVSQARSRALMGSGPSASLAGAVGGSVVHHVHEIVIKGDVDDLATGKQLVKALNSLSLATNGKGFTIREGVRK